MSGLPSEQCLIRQLPDNFTQQQVGVAPLNSFSLLTVYGNIHAIELAKQEINLENLIL